MPKPKSDPPISARDPLGYRWFLQLSVSLPGDSVKRKETIKTLVFESLCRDGRFRGWGHILYSGSLHMAGDVCPQ